MRRPLFTVVSALSLLLYIAAAAMCVRSYLAVDTLRHGAGPAETLWWSKAGQ